MTKAQLLQDIYFLAARAGGASRVVFGDNKRNTGVSSNSIVSIAYGLCELEEQKMPSDVSDMMACERMWQKLPEHRKVGNALKAMEAARNSNYYGKTKAA